MKDHKFQELLDEVLFNPNSTQEQLNAVLVQAIVDLRARVILLEPKQHEFKVCVECGSEFVTGMVTNDDGKIEWYCQSHLFGEI